MTRMYVLLMVCVLCFTGCGGGGGGGNDSVVPPSSPALVSSASSISKSSVSSESSSESSIASSSATSSSDVSQSELSSSSEVSSSSSSSETSAIVSSRSAVSTPARVAFTAWIGESNTVINLDPAAKGLDFVRTAKAGCNFLQYQQCESVEQTYLEETTATDTTLALGGHAHYALKNGDDVAALFIGTDKFLDRDGAAVVAFNGKLWLIGGSESGYKNDVWSSADGANWKKETAQAAFSARKYHRVAVFNNELWLVGGLTDNGRINDIWSSTDGVNWSLRNSSAAFSSRYEHTIFSFKGKLWLIGGETNDTENDIWSSSDGINWSRVVENAPFGPRSGMDVTEFNNQLFLTAGYANNAAQNDIWTSVDGVNWSAAVTHAAFSGRYGHAVYQFGGKLWLAGGYQSGFGSLNDLWSSADGLIWELAADELPETQMEHKVLSLNGNLFLLGGFLRENVWASTNNQRWEFKNTRATIPNACRYFELAGQLYATNGTDTLWRANELLEWESLPINNPVPAQSLCDLVVHENKLYVIGGFAGVGQYKNTIWSSDDGTTWTQISSAAAFSPRTSLAVASFKGALWIAGGNNFTQSFDDMWSSTNGVDWTKTHTFDLPSGGLIYKQLLVFKGKLWLVFNYGTIWAPERTIKAYSTADGVTWQAEALNNLVVQDNFSILVDNERLLLVNAHRSNRSAWSSTDGNNWTKVSDRAPFLITHFFRWNNESMIMGNPVSADEKNIDYSNHLWSFDGEFNWRRAYNGQFVFQQK